MADGVVVQGVGHRYAGGPPILHDVTFTLAPGSLTALVGPNGCGKSTLLRIVAGLLRPGSGVVLAAGVDVRRAAARRRAAAIGYLAQHEPADNPFTALELVLMARYPLQGSLPFDRGDDVAAARATLERTGAAHLASRRLSAMSGGERQRVAIARVLAASPTVLLLDEPAANLDVRHQVDAWEMLSAERSVGRTVLVVSHDLNLPGSYADRILVLHEGRIVRDGPPAEVLRASILAPVYGVSFHEARADGLSHPALVPRA